jgi:hypothetical protein
VLTHVRLIGFAVTGTLAVIQLSQELALTGAGQLNQKLKIALFQKLLLSEQQA